MDERGSFMETYRMAFIGRKQLAALADRITNEDYQTYLRDVLDEPDAFLFGRPVETRAQASV